MSWIISPKIRWIGSTHIRDCLYIYLSYLYVLSPSFGFRCYFRFILFRPLDVVLRLFGMKNANTFDICLHSIFRSYLMLLWDSFVTLWIKTGISHMNQSTTMDSTNRIGFLINYRRLRSPFLLINPSYILLTLFLLNVGYVLFFTIFFPFSA